MTQARRNSKGYRRGVRHQVELPCELISSHSDDPLLIWATDLSHVGVWLETREPLNRGDDVVLCFQPLSGWDAGEVRVFAQVQRVERRRKPRAPALGMALEFADLSAAEAHALSAWLAPRPRKTFEVRSGLRSLAPLLH
ncbi:MAG: PilZ domain-containing protein [Myxococcales bacterium]|nr:PilZ domain-containing protein [Myxococcales bacterium]